MTARTPIPLSLVEPTATPRRYLQRRLRWGAAALAAFYGLPWLPWEGRQAILVDLSQRQLQLFGLSLGVEAIPALACIVLAAAGALAALTTFAGRSWCAYTCPQTVLGRVLSRISEATRFEGAMKIPGLALRHAIWLALSLWTGLTFVGYFSPITALVDQLYPFAWSRWELAWAVFYGLATWANVLFLRHQVCRYLCPYARLQHLLHDADTLGVHYDARRGEPRAQATDAPRSSVLQRSRGLLNPTTAADYAFRASYPEIAGVMPRFATEHLGDCLDCGACTTACPRGLDIRVGALTQCIECGACIDACDARMRSAGFAAGLIRVSSPNTLAQHPSPRFRPKLLCGIAITLACLLVAAIVSAT